MTRPVGIALVLIGLVLLTAPVWLLRLVGAIDPHGFNIVADRLSGFAFLALYPTSCIACMAIGGWLIFKPRWFSLGALLIAIGLFLSFGSIGLLLWAHQMFTVGLSRSGFVTLAGVTLLGPLCAVTGAWLMLKPNRLAP